MLLLLRSAGHYITTHNYALNHSAHSDIFINLSCQEFY